MELVHDTVPFEELYREGGLQFLPFNSVYQLAVDRAGGALDVADRFLLIPDLVGYWLTGESVAERTNASTTGLLAGDGSWNEALIARLGLPRDRFAPLVDAGSPIGRLLPALAGDLPFDERTMVDHEDEPVTDVAQERTAALPQPAGPAR